MAIFQKSVVEKFLSNLDDSVIDSAYERFQEVYSASRINEIKTLKEEQYQEGFIRDIFVKVLGYTLQPESNYNIELEKQNQTDAKKVDAAILKDGKVIGVIELKGNNTKTLDSVKDQAFGYKNNHKGCKYVISSNFRRLRFYIDDATEHEEFDLYSLDRKEFARLFLFLSKEELLDKNTPDRLKDKTKFHEEDITKELYKDYSSFKHKFFNNIVKNNPQYDRLLLFKKSQKFLDRILFVLFAEDKKLIPENAISLIVDSWEKADDLQFKPLYDLFNIFFKHLNEGHTYKKTGYVIPAYNGGLFKKDEVLDNISVDDEVLRDDLLILSKYDFNTEVDVNILGHIFEHSLTELEEIEAEIKGEVADNQKSKRKKDGVFYTPKYITKYIVENTIGKLCNQKKEELKIEDFDVSEYQKRNGKVNSKGEVLFNVLGDYKKWLFELRILDPACGSGAFLNQALSFLIKEHKFIDDLIAELTNTSLRLFDTDKAILEKNIFGVDINDESIEIAKLSLWLRTAQEGRKLSNLSNNIKCGNSLISDVEVAGDKAFDWQKEFPDVFANGGFDVVIGNPPYVRVQFLAYNEIDWYKKNKETAFKRIDISTLFFEESYKLLKNNGRLCFITSNQFQTTEYGKETRRFISEKFRINKILDFADLPVFEGALTYVSIYSLSKNPPNDFSYKRVKSIEEARSGNYINFINIAIQGLSEKKWTLASKVELELLKKLEKFKKLGEYGNAWAGLFTGLDDILMFDKDEMLNSGIEEDLFLPIIRANDPIRNGLAKPSKYVIYPYKEENNKTVVYSEEELRLKFPKGYKYLIDHKESLQDRKDSRKTFKDRNDWYALTRFGRRNIFNQPKIVSPGEVKEHKFSLDKSGSGFSCARVFAITVDKHLSILTLLSILNSKLLKFFLQRKSSLKAGGYYSYSSKVLNEVPLSTNINEELVEILNLSINFNSEFKEIDDVFTALLFSKFNLKKLSKKLQNWHKCDLSDFLKELKTVVKKLKKEHGTQYKMLSLSQEAEWIQYFNEQKEKAHVLKTEINKNDRKINEMVYELYGLTQEEIKIVEES